MTAHDRIRAAFDGALRLPLRPDSRYVLFSDCHRGTGTANDNYLKNEFLWLAAARHYFCHGFTYLELGDGDELWENRSFEKIKAAHPETFLLLSRYYTEGRFFAIYGNHDMVKKSSGYVRRSCCSRFCEEKLCDVPLFPGITFYPGIILENRKRRQDVYLIHGHQADLLNSTLWRLSRFLVRYVWRPLELLGVPDPTSAAKNNTKKK